MINRINTIYAWVEYFILNEFDRDIYKFVKIACQGIVENITNDEIDEAKIYVLDHLNNY